MSADSPDHEQAESLRRMRTEGPAYWRDMDRQIQRSHWEYRWTDSKFGAGAAREPRLRDVRVTYLDNCFLIRVNYRDAPERETVYARNSRYGFCLEGYDSGTPDARWSVAWVGEERGDTISVDSSEAEFGGMLKLPWSITMAPLERLVASPRFVVRGATTRQIAGRTCLIVEFEVAPADGQSDDFGGLTAGEMILDPQSSWALVGYVAQYGQKRMSDTVELEYDALGSAHLKRVKFDLQTPRGTIMRTEIDVEKREDCQLTETDFTLSAFGLPEPRRSRLRSNGFRLGMLLVGITCAVCAFVVRRMGSKARNTAAK